MTQGNDFINAKLDEAIVAFERIDDECVVTTSEAAMSLALDKIQEIVKDILEILKS